jgi:hypothetical protein
MLKRRWLNWKLTGVRTAVRIGEPVSPHKKGLLLDALSEAEDAGLIDLSTGEGADLYEDTLCLPMIYGGKIIESESAKYRVR